MSRVMTMLATTTMMLSLRARPHGRSSSCSVLNNENM